LSGSAYYFCQVQGGKVFYFSREKESKNPPYRHLTEVEVPPPLNADNLNGRCFESIKSGFLRACLRWPI
jgi:hypothetical protein